MNPGVKTERFSVRKRFFAAFATVVVSLVLTFALFEAGFLIWLELIADKEQIAKYGSVDQVSKLPAQYVRHCYLPFIPTPDYENGLNQHNSLGFRGEEIRMPKPEDVFRIAAVGGSTTYSIRVKDYRKSYPYQLQNLLRQFNPSVEVINAGVGRYSTWESLLNLILRVLGLEPDLVVVYHGINDVHNRLVYPFESYRGDNSGSIQPYVTPYEKGLMHSALVRFLTTRVGLRKPVAGLLYIRTEDWLPTNFTLEFREQKIRETYPSGIFERAGVAEMLENNPPCYFKRNLENIIAICRFHGIRVVLMTFASSAKFTDRPLASSSEYQSAFREQNDVIRKICLEHGVPCYDFAADMPDSRKYWTDGRHLNARGNLLKAQLVAGFLQAEGLIPEIKDKGSELKVRVENSSLPESLPYL